MSDSNNGGALVAVYWILTIALSIFAGIIAWNLTEPDGFFGLIGFLLLWGVLSTVAHFLSIGIVKLFEGMG